MHHKIIEKQLKTNKKQKKNIKKTFIIRIKNKIMKITFFNNTSNYSLTA